MRDVSASSVGSRTQDIAALQMDRDAATLAQQPTTSLGMRASPANMCYIIFTSGSTGRPKGTMLQHASVVHYLFGHARCGYSWLPHVLAS